MSAARGGGFRGRGRGSEQPTAPRGGGTRARGRGAGSNTQRGMTASRGPSGQSSRGSAPRGPSKSLRTFDRGNARTSPSPPPVAEGTAEKSVAWSERFQLLTEAREKERADAIRKGLTADPEKPRSLSEAITPVGTCQDMCPEFERVQRVVQQDVWKEELAPLPYWEGRYNATNKVPDESRMVKKFRRAAAGLEEQLPSDLRPPQVLQETCDYLFYNVAARTADLAEVHHFIWDRTRAIRNDFSIQQLTKLEDLCIAIHCYERIARFHIWSLHMMATRKKPYPKYDWQQEREQLDRTLLSLLQYYDDTADRIDSPNEPEFRAYCILLQLQSPTPDLEDRMQDWPKRITEDASVKKAVELYTAACNIKEKQGPLKYSIHLIALQDWQRFWSILSSDGVSYLMACAAEVNFNVIRRLVLNALFRTFRNNMNLATTDWTMEVVNDLLLYDAPNDARVYCEAFGFIFKEREDGEMYLDLASVKGRTLPEPSNAVPKQFFSFEVESKRGYRAAPAILDGLPIDAAFSKYGMMGVYEDEDEEAKKAGLLGGMEHVHEEADEDEDSLFIPEKPVSKVPLDGGFTSINSGGIDAKHSPFSTGVTGSTFSIADVADNATIVTPFQQSQQPGVDGNTVKPSPFNSGLGSGSNKPTASPFSSSASTVGNKVNAAPNPFLSPSIPSSTDPKDTKTSSMGGGFAQSPFSKPASSPFSKSPNFEIKANVSNPFQNSGAPSTTQSSPFSTGFPESTIGNSPSFETKHNGSTLVQGGGNQTASIFSAGNDAPKPMSFTNQASPFGPFSQPAGDQGNGTAKASEAVTSSSPFAQPSGGQSIFTSVAAATKPNPFAQPSAPSSIFANQPVPTAQGTSPLSPFAPSQASAAPQGNAIPSLVPGAIGEPPTAAQPDPVISPFTPATQAQPFAAQAGSAAIGHDQAARPPLLAPSSFELKTSADDQSNLGQPPDGPATGAPSLVTAPLQTKALQPPSPTSSNSSSPPTSSSSANPSPHSAPSASATVASPLKRQSFSTDTKPKKPSPLSNSITATDDTAAAVTGQQSELEATKARESAQKLAQQAKQAAKQKAEQDYDARITQLTHDVLHNPIDGLLTQYCDFVVGKAITAAQDAITLEQNNREADEYRHFRLCEKYAIRWRQNFWNQRLARTGRERRQRRRRRFEQRHVTNANSSQESQSAYANSRTSSALAFSTADPDTHPTMGISFSKPATPVAATVQRPVRGSTAREPSRLSERATPKPPTTGHVDGRGRVAKPKSPPKISTAELLTRSSYLGIPINRDYTSTRDTTVSNYFRLKAMGVHRADNMSGLQGPSRRSDDPYSVQTPLSSLRQSRFTGMSVDRLNDPSASRGIKRRSNELHSRQTSPPPLRASYKPRGMARADSPGVLHGVKRASQEPHLAQTSPPALRSSYHSNPSPNQSSTSATKPTERPPSPALDAVDMIIEEYESALVKFNAKRDLLKGLKEGEAWYRNERIKEQERQRIEASSSLIESPTMAQARAEARLRDSRVASRANSTAPEPEIPAYWLRESKFVAREDYYKAIQRSQDFITSQSQQSSRAASQMDHHGVHEGTVDVSQDFVPFQSTEGNATMAKDYTTAKAQQDMSTAASDFAPIEGHETFGAAVEGFTPVGNNEISNFVPSQPNPVNKDTETDVQGFIPGQNVAELTKTSSTAPPVKANGYSGEENFQNGFQPTSTSQPAVYQAEAPIDFSKHTTQLSTENPFLQEKSAPSVIETESKLSFTAKQKQIQAEVPVDNTLHPAQVPQALKASFGSASNQVQSTTEGAASLAQNPIANDVTAWPKPFSSTSVWGQQTVGQHAFGSSTPLGRHTFGTASALARNPFSNACSTATNVTATAAPIETNPFGSTSSIANERSRAEEIVSETVSSGTANMPHDANQSDSNAMHSIHHDPSSSMQNGIATADHEDPPLVGQYGMDYAGERGRALAHPDHGYGEQYRGIEHSGYDGEEEERDRALAQRDYGYGEQYHGTEHRGYDADEDYHGAEHDYREHREEHQGPSDHPAIPYEEMTTSQLQDFYANAYTLEEWKRYAGDSPYNGDDDTDSMDSSDGEERLSPGEVEADEVDSVEDGRRYEEEILDRNEPSTFGYQYTSHGADAYGQANGSNDEYTEDDAYQVPVQRGMRSFSVEADDRVSLTSEDGDEEEEEDDVDGDYDEEEYEGYEGYEGQEGYEGEENEDGEGEYSGLGWECDAPGYEHVGHTGQPGGYYGFVDGEAAGFTFQHTAQWPPSLRGNVWTAPEPQANEALQAVGNTAEEAIELSD